MSLRGYKKKHGPALWCSVFPRQQQPPKPKRIRPVSKRRQKINKEYAAKARAFVQAAAGRGERCVIVNSILELSGQNDQLTQTHHIRGRDGKLLMDENYWMAVSAAGHAWIDRNRKEAQKRGWLAQKGEWGKQ